jgi:serine/threonine-protein kinase
MGAADADRFEIVRPLGADAAAFVARDTSIKPSRLVVLERPTRGVSSPEERARIVRQCKALVTLEHPKVAPVREVVERDGEVQVVCDYVDGEWLSALMAVDPRPPVEVLLRIMLDVLEGLAALHDLRDDRGQPLKLVHGAISPDTVLVADDGVAEIARPFGVAPHKPDRFVAPELRRGEAPVDVRADVYSAGAILREILGGASADAKWAEQLTDIAWRACSVDPENRWPSTASMATTLRRIAGSKLASSDDLAKFLRRYFGNRMNARRTALEMLDESGPISSGEPISVRPSEMVVIDPASAPTLVESRPPPVPVRSNVAKVTLVKKSLELVELPEPAVERPVGNVGNVTQKGMAAIAPPAPIFQAPLTPKAPSLPPPDIIVPDIIPAPLSTPPRAARVSAVPQPEEVSESYRRRMPTFPTMDPPPRRSSAVQVMAIAAAMVSTFGVGWWLGRNAPPPGDAPQVVCPSTVSPPVVQAPATTAAIPAVVVTASAPAPSTSAVASAPPTAAAINTTATGGATGAPTAVATSAVPTSAPASSALTAAVTRPTTAVAPAVPLKPAPAPGPSVVAVDPKAAETKPPPPPRPAGSAGYVPGEL